MSAGGTHNNAYSVQWTQDEIDEELFERETARENVLFDAQAMISDSESERDDGELESEGDLANDEDALAEPEDMLGGSRGDNGDGPLTDPGQRTEDVGGMGDSGERVESGAGGEGEPTGSSSLQSKKCCAVTAILACIRQHGMSLGTFLDALRLRHSHPTLEAAAAIKEIQPQSAAGRAAKIDPLLRSTDHSLSKDELTRVHINDLEHGIRSGAPTIWTLLENTAYTPKQRKNNIHNHQVVLCMVAMLLYSRSHHCNRLQRLFAIYFKFKGLSANGCDTLHALGITMSTKWSVISFVRQHQCALSSLLADSRLDAHLVHELQISRARGMSNPIAPMDIVKLAIDSYPSIEKYMIHHVLQVLLQAGEFDLHSYRERASPHFHSPPPIEELPCGPEHVTLQYMLGSVPIPEATYEDNDKVMSELLAQLGYDSPEKR